MSEGGGAPGDQPPPGRHAQGQPYGAPPRRQAQPGQQGGPPRGPMPPWQQQPAAPSPPPPPTGPVTRPALPDWGQGPDYGQQPPGPPPPPPTTGDPWGQDEPGPEPGPSRFGAEQPQIGGPQWNWQPSLDYAYTPRRPRRKGLLIGLGGGGGAALVLIVVLLVWLFTRGGDGDQPDVGYHVAWQVKGDGRAPVDAYLAGSLAIRADVLGVSGYDVADGSRKWHVAVPGGEQLCTVSPNAPGNVLAFVHGAGASNCTTVTAIDTTTGKTLWQANPPVKSGVKPAAAGVAVLQNKVVVSNGYRVVGYDAKTGKALWNIGPSNAQCGPGDLMASSSVLIALVDCTAKNVSKADDGIYSINPADGKTVWTAHLPNDHGYAPPRVVAVAPPVVRVEDESGKPRFQVFDGQGRPTTSFTPDGGAGVLDDRASRLDVRASLHIRYPFVVTNDVLVGMGRTKDGIDGVAVGVDLTDGKRKWERKLGDGYDGRLIHLQTAPPAGRLPLYERKPGSSDGYQRLGLLDSGTGQLAEGEVVTRDVGALDGLFYLSGTSVVVMAKSAAARQAITAYAPK